VGDASHVLREYAFLGDGERGILVGPRGDFVWMCFPGWADEGIFSTLIGGRGSYAITPAGRFVWGGYYEPGTLIWHSRWVTEDNSIVECREALALPARPDRAVVLRRLRACSGAARVDVTLDVRGSFGDTALEGLTRDDRGCWRGRLGEIHVCWGGGVEATVERADGSGSELRLPLRLEEGEVRDFVLVLGDEQRAPLDPDAAWRATEEAWSQRIPLLEETAAPRDARHALAIMTGLTSASGGMVAAATTSLPERAGSGRNYDYRYVWIRDQCFAGQAVAAIGPHPVTDDAVRFVTARLLEDGRGLAPAYTTSGGRVPDEKRLELPGYPGGTDVVGNHANGQFQLDCFGEALLLFAAAAGNDRLDADAWRAAEIAVGAIEARWHEPDSGIWELDPDEWTHSRLMCAAGLREIAGYRPGSAGAAPWLGLAEAIVADTSARAVHPSGRWQRSPRDERCDTALLLAAIRGAVPADDPRSLATLAGIANDLTEDGYAYRYRQDGLPLGETEGAFLLCGFILSLAYLQQGSPVAAARWFERNRAACGPAALLAEEFDVEQRQLRGNLPQAFVHALLLECAARLGPEVDGP
jgi:GH15 family glucan-1,4-alpha-glucosidase